MRALVGMCNGPMRSSPWAIRSLVILHLLRPDLAYSVAQLWTVSPPGDSGGGAAAATAGAFAVAAFFAAGFLTGVPPAALSSALRLPPPPAFAFESAGAMINKQQVQSTQHGAHVRAHE